MAELTPMKRQYYEIKQQYQDCLLVFRLGDFYEMFDDDARLASKLLDLALTTRDRSVENPDERTPMCGIPYHSAETYIARLIAKGYLKELESSGIGPAVTPKAADDQISLADVGADEVRDILLRTDVNTLTPLEAMNLLFELQKKARA